MSDLAFVGLPIYRTHHVERGTFLVAQDMSVRNGQCIFEGVGLGRGIAYTDHITVERGYLVGPAGPKVTLVDAVNGRVVHVNADDCVPVEERYAVSTIAEALG